MEIKYFTKTMIAGMLTLSIAACGSGGGSGLSSEGGVANTLKATALNNKTVIAAAPKTNHLDTMLALLTVNEVTAAHAPGNCADDAKEFMLSDSTGLASVCLKSALIVYEEIEFEQEGISEGDDQDDDVETGPYVMDLIGTADDGISGSISLSVPDGIFNKIEIKIGDLDDRGADDGSLDDSPSSSDDRPVNTSIANANSAGLAGHSLVITGTAHDGTNNQDFTFKTNLEAKIEMPFTLPSGANPVVDGSSLITLIDLVPGFLKLAYADVTAAGFGNGNFGVTENCASPKNNSQGLACDIVKNIDLFDDDDNDDVAEVEEHRGDNHNGDGGGGLFDDSGNRD